MKRVYAGIGSRSLPGDVERRIHFISKKLCSYGYTLRSGGAAGCDSAFERYAGDKKEIYLPWKNFNNNKSNSYTITPSAVNMAMYYHPSSYLSPSVTKLMARNCYQVLGKNLNEPVDFVVCYTQNGEMSGGTSQAMRIANEHNIPVYNIYSLEGYCNFLTYLRKLII